jgi:3',5'-nucleoside bisphosphate phosphatase
MVTTVRRVIDLHLHSRWSDGSESPETVIELAVAAGCSAVALTDHDTIEGLSAAATRAQDLGIDFVHGCEISCESEGSPMHLLCYFVDVADSPFTRALVNIHEARLERNAALIAHLQSLGLPVTTDEVATEAGGGEVGRPHIAAVLVRNGAASSMGDAFDRYLAEGRPGYVTWPRIEAAGVIAAARASGALCALAHPHSVATGSELQRKVSALTEAGLSGLECYYATYDKADRDALLALARRTGLVPTGGSDWHGSYSSELSVGVGRGDLRVPDAVLDELRSRLLEVRS